MKHHCEQCGREGTREFTTLGGFWHDGLGWVPFITVCASKKACRRRWPKQRAVDE